MDSTKEKRNRNFKNYFFGFLFYRNMQNELFDKTLELYNLLENENYSKDDLRENYEFLTEIT